MIVNRILSLLVISSLIIVSCSGESNDDDINNEEKQQTDDNTIVDDSESEEEPEEKSTYGLKIGNYWVYKYSRLNRELDVFEDTGVIDSIVVLGKDVIGEKEYFKLKRVTSGNKGRFLSNISQDGESIIYRREENRILYELRKTEKENNVDVAINKEIILYQLNNTAPYIYISNPSWDVYSDLDEIKTDVTTPAGSFDCYLTSLYAIYTNGEERIGKRTGGTSYIYYAEGIGLIQEKTSYLTRNHHFQETNLLRYRVD